MNFLSSLLYSNRNSTINAEHYKNKINKIINKNNEENSECRFKLLKFLLHYSSNITETEQINHCWSELHKSPNIVVEFNPFHFLRIPERTSTDAIRGKIGYNKGLHIWKILWPTDKRGTHATIGVCTDKSLLHYDEYVSLVGIDSESWGWDISRLEKYHNYLGESCPYDHSYPSKNIINNLKLRQTFYESLIPSEILVILDMDKGTLAFMIDNIFLGIAFTGLKGKTLYPTVGAVWGNCTVGLLYQGGYTEPPTLFDLGILASQELIEYHCDYCNDHLISNIYYPFNFIGTVNKLDIPEILKDEIKRSYITFS